MNVLAFIAALVTALAWPSAVLIGIALLRKPLMQLIPTIKRFQYRELAIDFERRLEDAAATVAEVLKDLPPESARRALEGAEPSALQALIDASPPGLIMRAWQEVEAAAVAAVQRLRIPVLRFGSTPESPVHAIRALEHSDRLSPAARAMLFQLRRLRDEAAHYPELDITKESAQSYLETAAAIVHYISELGAA